MMRELKIFEDFGYDWIDDSCLGEFWWKCPKCEHNSKDDRYNLYIQLGDTLIKNENIALLELIKNSYDADSRKVKVKLALGQNKQNSRIDVIDLRVYCSPS